MFSDLNPVVALTASASNSELSFNTVRSYFSNSGILISRPTASDSRIGLSAAFKLLGNEGIHSHNDIGSYEIFFNGFKVTGDSGGVDTYTGDSFGRNRFNSALFNSFGHPVPTVNDKLQINAATDTTNILDNTNHPRVLDQDFSSPNVDSVTYDLTGAYNDSSLVSLKRVIVYSREVGNIYITIEDQFSFSSPSTFESALIAPSGWYEPTRVFWNNAAPNLLLQVADLSNVATTWNTRTIVDYGRTIRRISIKTNGQFTSGSIKYRFTTRTKCSNSQFYDSQLNACSECVNSRPNQDGTHCLCNAGSFWNSDQKACVQCGVNQYSAAGQTTCTACPEYTSSPEGSSFCIVSAGKYWDLSTERPAMCPVNTFSNRGATQCTACPSGTTSNTWKSGCVCGDGFMFNSATARCDICSEGKYAAAGSNSCQTCSAGTFSNAGSSSCTNCSKGTFSGSNGAHSCASCPTNKHSSLEGATECLHCPPGYVPNTGLTGCTPCAAGTFSNGFWSTCIPCAKGTTSPAGSSQCFKI